MKKQKKPNISTQIERTETSKAFFHLSFLLFSWPYDNYIVSSPLALFSNLISVSMCSDYLETHAEQDKAILGKKNLEAAESERWAIQLDCYGRR